MCRLPRHPEIFVGTAPSAGYARVTGSSQHRKPSRAARIAR